MMLIKDLTRLRDEQRARVDEARWAAMMIGSSGSWAALAYSQALTDLLILDRTLAALAKR